MGLCVLLELWILFTSERQSIEAKQRVCQWWVSGRTPDGREQHYLLRA